MTHSIISESFIFLSMILCGMTSGVLYAFLYGLRRVVKKKFSRSYPTLFCGGNACNAVFALEKPAAVT